MRYYQWMWIGFVVAALALDGCSSKRGIDTAAFSNLFSSADPALQTHVEKAVAAIKSADYRQVKNELHIIREDPKLTPEQSQAAWALMKKLN